MWTTPVLGAERGLPVFCLKSRREILRSILRWTEYPVERNLVFEPVTVWFFRERRDVALKAPNWTMVESDSSTGENTCLVSRSFCHPKVAIVTNIPAVPLFLYAFLLKNLGCSLWGWRRSKTRLTVLHLPKHQTALISSLLLFLVVCKTNQRKVWGAITCARCKQTSIMSWCVMIIVSMSCLAEPSNQAELFAGAVLTQLFGA